jgi:hypothetical protein
MPRRPKSPPKSTPKKPSLSVVVGDFATGRPPPPSDLTDRQAAIWRSIVETEPTELFGTSATRNLLVDYCRHRETSETYTALVQSFDKEWLKTADGLDRFRAICRGRDVEDRAAVTLAMKLRLTNQSRQTPKATATAARHAAKGLRPWEA